MENSIRTLTEVADYYKDYLDTLSLDAQYEEAMDIAEKIDHLRAAIGILKSLSDDPE